MIPIMEQVCHVLSSWSVDAGILDIDADDIKTLVCRLRLALRKPGNPEFASHDIHRIALEMAPICNAVHIDWAAKRDFHTIVGTDFHFELCMEVEKSVRMQKKFAHEYVIASKKRPFCSYSGYCIVHFSEMRICILATVEQLDQKFWEWVAYTVRFGWSHWFDTALCLEGMAVTVAKAHKNPRENAKRVAQLGLLRSDICK